MTFCFRFRFRGAVLCVTDERGAQILGLARECGRAVPEQLSILGIDNDPLLCQIAHPPLSSIDTNPVALGTAIAKRLDRLMSGDDPGDPPKIRPVGVVERASTAWEAVADPHLVQALAFVRRSVGKRISVDDVARASGDFTAGSGVPIPGVFPNHRCGLFASTDRRWDQEALVGNGLSAT